MTDLIERAEAWLSGGPSKDRPYDIITDMLAVVRLARSLLTEVRECHGPDFEGWEFPSLENAAAILSDAIARPNQGERRE